MRRLRMGLTTLCVSIAISVLASATGCGSSALHEAGTSCSSDGDCAAGLSCLGLANNSGGGCTEIAKACTKTCSSDLDCLAVGSSFHCLPSCGTAQTCVLTRTQTD